tara:strand:+ start:2981 stop:3490 length:510 start_codon:yes stop_codon:yes gene_type:complete
MKTFSKVQPDMPPMKDWLADMMKAMQKVKPRPTRKQLINSYYAAKNDDIRVNDIYQVAIDWDSEKNGALTPDPSIKVIHLSIKRRDKQPIMDYRDLMDIKDALVGSEFEALMIYPARFREHDMANQYHLWIPVNRETDEGVCIPFGWNNGRKVFDKDHAGATQRPFRED